MHAYDTPPRRSFSSVPSARAAHEPSGGSSATPIYDSLYAEWVRTFRTLPGDRSGEEELGFSAFGDFPDGTGTYGGHRAGSFSSSYSAYSAGAYSARQQSQWQRVGTLGRQHETGMQHVPAAAALPPGPRRSA
ncbi:hypothetical protein AQJ11_36595 [Streptomyces corchorusii]|uniref:Uncharacterized protein n=3 Tax=Streptomyces TaxID=1883 RepID=A0A117QAL0_STRCK|nr:MULTISPECIES: hypothetical protein [Streptomyces]AEY88480.1 hypothetical protein SHJG_3206 [Streptomyces hygroscopicus subsp. jinggangensis 5008]KUN17818.1 hypothetical protein AQJ11_36595 [Streptomyces corchorusii]GGY75439.1 hypothetical protein GCM10010300_18790 [Streptomyces olivaceoviridis]GHA06713.1 hypothetical protein GCM10010345_09100 [Streptomyces canarius]